MTSDLRADPPSEAGRVEGGNLDTLKFDPSDDRSYQTDAVNALLSDRNVFLSGRAGTGKSSIIKDWLNHHGDNVIRLAPTGVAAINVGGQTIHRFIHWHPGVGLRHVKATGENLRRYSGALYDKLDAIVVDEIGMVRSDLLDMLDAFLQGARGDDRPFGGARMVFTGDLLQLPPVVTAKDKSLFTGADARYASPWFFHAPNFQRMYEAGDFACIELRRVYRQDEPEFLNLLAGIRLGHPDPKLLNLLNSTCSGRPFDPDATVLTPINRIADGMNREGLESLPGRPRTFDARVTGDWKVRDMLTPEHLELKVGAKVMTLVNDPCDEYVNGSTGVVSDMNRDAVTVTLDGGREVRVEPHRWSQYRAELRTSLRGEAKLVNTEVGSFTQFPLKLAYASSIHKAQGLTLDRMNLALNGTRMFSDGQAYVALSRCRSLEGIRLDRPIGAGECTAARQAVDFLRYVGCLSEAGV